MHPVIFYWKVPVTWAGFFGPGTGIFNSWKILAVAAALCFAAWIWATSPDHKTPQKLWTWLSGAGVLALGLPLLGVALVRMGEIKIHTYGVMLSIAFITGIILAVQEAKRVGEDPERILDLTFWILVSSIVGARVLFILTMYQDYLANPKKLFQVWEGGLVFYGGFLGAAALSWWFIRKHKMNFFKVADILVPSVVLGQVFGRMGCFAAGCCFGKTAPPGMSWAVKFPIGDAARHGLIHPTQLYESFSNLFIFFLLLWLRSRKKFHGVTLVGYLLAYSTMRFIIEIFRGDKIRGFLFEWDFIKSIPDPEILSTSQTVSVALFLMGVGLWVWLRGRANQVQAA
ncbi:MAG: prolipoprotein diacylglyceryl transferase [Deltaproteobacteria bacterium]|nr:MAG: prolipoprotein diacylglyceryl transferase [Deltaproteobacteria bacterium]